MARIAGVNLPVNKRALVSLTYIHGIGPKYAMDILKANNLDPTKRIKDFSEDEVSKIRKSIDESYTVEGDLRRDVSQNIRRKTISHKRTNNFVNHRMCCQWSWRSQTDRYRYYWRWQR